MKGQWSAWRPFPDPGNGGLLTAPFGPGCYELRHQDGNLILFGMGGHVAARMTSLLPPPHGAGTRNNRDKRSYVHKRLATIEYRTIACANRQEALSLEKELTSNKAAYVFPER